LKGKDNLVKNITIHTLLIFSLLIAMSVPCAAVPAAGTFDLATATEEAKKVLNVYRDPKNTKYSNDLQRWENEGYIKRSDLEKAEIGEGFRICFFSSMDLLLNEETPFNPATSLTPTGIWYFLVRVDGKPWTILNIQSKTKSSGIGATELHQNQFFSSKDGVMIAKTLDRLLSAWPAAEGYQYRIVSGLLDNRLKYAIELSQNGKVLGFFPLIYIGYKEERVAESFTASDLVDPNLFLANARSEVRRLKRPHKVQPDKK
jgi:hypothetical protein